MQDPKQYLADYRAMKAQAEVSKKVKAGASINEQASLEREIATMEQGSAERLEAINSLSDPRYREVCTLRYVEGMRWEKIEDKTHYGRSSIFRLHKQALEELKKKMEGNT